MATCGNTVARACEQCGTEYIHVIKRGPQRSRCDGCYTIHRRALNRNNVAIHAQRKRLAEGGVCGHCGERHSYKRNKFCSDACRRASATARYLRLLGRDKKPQRHYQCSECGTGFTSARLDARFCSPECGKRQAWRSGCGQRRARIRKVKRERFDPFAVFDRDGWKCHLCGVKTPKRLRGSSDDRAPELDHLIPLAAGGDHTMVNTACACRKCNLTKGAQPLGQLRLIG